MKQTEDCVFSETEWKRLRNKLKLSERQVEIIRLMCEGHKNYSVAQILGISVNTVRAHLRQLYAKLGVTDRFELLCLLIKTNRKIGYPGKVVPKD